MNIAILHHDIESPEIKFKELFEEKGCFVRFFDIREVSDEEFLDYDLVFNRVYSSVASRDFEVLKKTLLLLKNLENNGIKCVNSSMASLADYSKFDLFKFLSLKGILTPLTLFVGLERDIEEKAKEAIKEFGFPIVIKRNCGGKSYDVTKVYSLEELKKSLFNSFKVAKIQGYGGGFLLQKFMKSIKDHDCRVAVINGKFVFSYMRTLITRNSSDKWLASTSGGSFEMDYYATKEEENIAIRANKAINASFSESDIIITNEGPCIIEVNLSPGYFVDNIEDINRMKIIVDNLIEKNIPAQIIKIKARN